MQTRANATVSVLHASRSKVWKSTERSFAKAIGGEREHFEAQDVRHPIFSGEVKHRCEKGYPKTVRGWLDQARRNAPGGKIPIVCVHQSGERHAEDMVVMRLADFEDLLGRLHIPALESIDNASAKEEGAQ